MIGPDAAAATASRSGSAASAATGFASEIQVSKKSVKCNGFESVHYLINDFREAISEAKDEDLREPDLVGNMRVVWGATLEARRKNGMGGRTGEGNRLYAAFSL